MAWQTWSDVSVDTVVTHTMLNNISTDLKQTMPALSTAAGQWFTVTAANTIAARIPDAAQDNTSTSVTSTSYSTLASGPAVSLVTGPRALVLYSALLSPGDTGESGYMSYRVTGATTQSGTDQNALQITTIGAGDVNRASMFDLAIQLSSTAANTFTSVFRSSTSGSTCTVSNKEIAVIPF